MIFVLINLIFIALIHLGEEIAADAMDIKGDKLISSKSIAIKYGSSIALKFSGFIFLLVIMLSIIPFLLNWFSIIYLVPIGIMYLAIAYKSLKLISTKEDEGRKHIRWIYLGAISGIIIFIVMRLVGI